LKVETPRALNTRSEAGGGLQNPQRRGNETRGGGEKTDRRKDRKAGGPKQFFKAREKNKLALGRRATEEFETPQRIHSNSGKKAPPKKGAGER